MFFYILLGYNGGVKKRIFLIISIIAGLLFLVFLGICFYWMHRLVWESAWAVIYMFIYLGMALVFMIVGLIFFNEAGIKGAVRIAVNIAAPLIMLIGPGADIAIERISFDAYTSFSPEKWLTVDEGYKYVMTNDFLAKYEVKGMKVEEVVSLLGEPQEEGSLAEGETYAYYFRYDCGRPTTRYAIEHYFLDFYTMGEDRTISISDYSFKESQFSPTKPAESA